MSSATHLAAAQRALQDRDRQAVKRHCAMVLADQQASVNDRFKAAECCYQIGILGLAERLLRAVLQADAKVAPAHIALGQVLVRLQRWSEAEDCFQRAVSLAPKAPEPLLILADYWEQRQRPERAEPCYRRALALAPKAANICDSLGRVLDRQAKYQEAEKAFRKAIRLNPRYAPAHYNLANIAQRAGYLEEAAAAFRQALEFDPNMILAEAALGQILYRLEQFEEAEKLLVSATQKQPRSLPAWLNLALLYLMDKRPEQCVDACRGALAIAPHEGNAHALMAMALRDAGEQAEADRLTGMDELIRTISVSVPDGYSDLAAFNAALLAEVEATPDRYSEPGTEKGRQTRNLFTQPGPALEAFRQILDRQVAAYIDYFAPSAAPHPFLARAPKSWALEAWATVMNEIEPGEDTHIHPSGWLSGVYYAQIPPGVAKADDAAHQGWIEFGRPPHHIKPQTMPHLKLLKPAVGRLFLFPSYLYHRVMPFKQQSSRVSLAFDATPTD